MTKWSEKSGPMEWSVTIFSISFGVIIMSSVTMDMGGGGDVWITRLKEVSSLFKDWIIGGLGMLKSPSMILLDVIVDRDNLHSSRNKLMLGEVGQ